MLYLTGEHEMTSLVAQGHGDVNVWTRPLGTEKPATMPVVLYRDEDGNPTCACDFKNGRVCVFYGVQKFGCSETCWFADKDGRRWVEMKRRNGGKGTLVPLPTCPLWHNDVLTGGAEDNQLLAEREARYGAFKDNSELSQALKAVMRSGSNWEKLDADMKEALEMNAHKISRILCGDPQYDDSWVDIAGYAKRVADRLRA
jgi:hypothetical protein